MGTYGRRSRGPCAHYVCVDGIYCDNENQDNGTNGQLRVIEDAEQVHAVAKYRERQHPQKRANGATSATKEAGPTHNAARGHEQASLRSNVNGRGVETRCQ